MRCPYCHGLRSTCVDSRLSEDQASRMRRHRCQDCGKTWTTTEVSDTDLWVAKQTAIDNACAPFLRDRAHLADLVGELDQLKTKYMKML